MQQSITNKRCAYLQSFSGHQSPIDCVNFDYAEEVVAAGGANGTIKLWDLDSSKGECLLRTSSTTASMLCNMAYAKSNMGSAELMCVLDMQLSGISLATAQAVCRLSFIPLGTS